MSRRSSGCALQNKQREAVHLIVEFEDDPETFYTVMVYQVQHFANREDLKRGNYILLVRPFALLAAEEVMSWKPAGTSDTCLGVDCCLDRPRVLSPGAAAEEFPHLLIDDARLVINSTPLTQMQPKAGFTGVMWVETVEESSVWDGSAVVTVVTGVDGTSSAQLLIMPSYDSAYEVKIKKHMPLFVYCAMCTATHYGASGFRLQLRPGPCSYFSQRRDTIIDRCGLTTYNTACNVWSASAVALDNPCRVTADHFPLLNHGIGDVLDYAASAPQASVNVVLSGTIHAVGPAFRTSCGFVDLRCSRGSHTDPHRCTFMAGNTRQTTCDKCGVIDISGATYSLRVDIIDADGKRLENVRALTAAGNRIFNVADPMDYYVSTCIMSTAQREQHVAQLRQQVMGRKGIFALWRNGSKYFLCDIIFVSAPTPILHNQPSGPGTPGNSPAKKPRMR